MHHSTYAFENLSVTLSHPSVGQFVFQGIVLGSIIFAMANDSSAYDVASYGSVMTLKIRAGNGTVTISVQQTSQENQFLRKMFNYLYTASSVK